MYSLWIWWIPCFLQLCSDLVDAPSLSKIRNVLSLVVGNEAGGINGIMSEMIKASFDELLKYIPT